MTRSISARIAAAVLATGAATAFAFAGDGAANAAQGSTTTLTPGQGSCTASQYASYQVRGEGWATAQGAKFKLLRNGVVVSNSLTRGEQLDL